MAVVAAQSYFAKEGEGVVEQVGLRPANFVNRWRWYLEGGGLHPLTVVRVRNPASPGGRVYAFRARNETVMGP